MNEESDPSPAELALKHALQTKRPEDVPPRGARHDRIQKAVRGQTAAHDVGDFVLGNVFTALGKVLRTLWHLVTGSVGPSDKPANPPKKKRDEKHP